ncbi:MAG: hypothetical protein IKH88_02225 [Prevotella sp.]|nr:hypothetical protein [Prevotella sp.]
MEEKNEVFENWWQTNKQTALAEDREYREAIETYKMKSGADWLLFGIPVVTGIICVQSLPISHEILRWVASIAITVVVFVICVYVKSLSHPHRPISDIEADVKKRCLEEYLRTGKLGKQEGRSKSK